MDVAGEPSLSPWSGAWPSRMVWSLRENWRDPRVSVPQPGSLTRADQRWLWWPLLPLYPYGKRATHVEELIPGQVWSFEQLQGVYYVAVPIRLTVVKVPGGLMLVNPLPPRRSYAPPSQNSKPTMAPSARLCCPPLLVWSINCRCRRWRVRSQSPSFGCAPGSGVFRCNYR